MKKITLSIVTVCILAFSPMIANAKSPENPTAVTHIKGDTAGLYRLVNRVEEIKAIDKSKLSFAEKRELRKELRGIKDQMKAMDYIYISAGTLLLIIILLIIFL